MLVMLLLCGAASAQQPTWSSPDARPAPTPTAAPATMDQPMPLPQAPAIQVPSPLTPVRYQAPPDTSATGDYEIQLEPPGLERLAQMNSDPALQERIRQETLKRNPNERVVFPESPVLSRDTYKGRGNLWQQRQLTVEPNFVVYHNLLFEEKNAERYGWDLGPLQPLVTGGKFYLDVALAPMHLANRLCLGIDECSAGYCLPGDPVPFMIYPPEVTLSGTVAELGTIAVLIALFP